MNKHLKYNLLLVMVTFLWGSAFPILKIALSDEYSSPALILGVRFLLASLVLFIFFFKRIKDNFQIKIILPIFLFSLVLFGDYLFYGMGLKSTTAINAGFYNGIAVVFVPFVMLFFDRDALKGENLLPILIIVLGVYFLSSNAGKISFNIGDIFCLLSAVLFAFYIVLSSKKHQNFDFVCITVLQMAFVGVLGIIMALITDGKLDFSVYSQSAWIALIILGIFCTAIPFCLQHFAQPHSSPLFSAIIYSGMALFSTIMSMLLIDERLLWRGLFGGALIICGIVFAKIKPKKNKKTQLMDFTEEKSLIDIE